MKRRPILLPFILLCCLLLCSSCDSSGGRPKDQANQTNLTINADQKNQTDQSIKNYLEVVSSDFRESVEEFQVISEPSGDDLEGVTQALEAVENSKVQFLSWMENAKLQSVPSQPETILAFHNSLLQYYNDSISLICDYQEILRYSVDLYESLKPIEQAVDMDLGNEPSFDDVLAVVENLKDSITESTEAAKQCTPPHYMSYSHNDYVSILTRYGSATDDLAYALMLLDPLRINAATYRYDILANKLKVISDEMGADIDEKQTKMNELIDSLSDSQNKLSVQLSSLLDEYKIID